MTFTNQVLPRFAALLVRYQDYTDDSKRKYYIQQIYALNNITDGTTARSTRKWLGRLRAVSFREAYSPQSPSGT
jgi:hypothetical protein